MIDDAFRTFESNVERAYKISEINDQIIQIATDVLKGAHDDVSHALHKKRLEEKITLLENLQDSSVIQDILPIVYGQQVVLMVSASETYINEVVKIIGDRARHIIKWPDGKFNKQIDVELLQDSAVSIGDLILSIIRQNGNNFQDLQSIKRFFEEYLEVDLELDEIYENNYILGTAMRHSFVHSNGIADRQFLNQIRRLPEVGSYAEGSTINLTSEQVTELRDSFLFFGEAIKVKVEQKANE